MAVVDWILNFAGILLWLSWSSHRLERAASRPSVGLASTLRKASSRSAARWSYLLYLAGLLVLRSIFYWQVGSEGGLIMQLDLKAITLPFRCDRFLLMLVYSLLSFVLWLGVLYTCLLLLSVINRKVSDSEPVQRIIRAQLGWIERLPFLLRLVLPIIAAVAGWLVTSPLLSRLDVIPGHSTGRQLWEQAALLGAGAVLLWKLPIVILLLLHFVTSYVYLGTGTFLSFITTTARNFLRLAGRIQFQIGKLDLTPLVAIFVVMVLAESWQWVLLHLYQWLQL